MSTVRINDNIKKEVTPILESLGLSLSEAINIYLHQIKLNNGIPFSLKLETPNWSDDMLEALEEAKDIEAHPENYKSYSSVEEFMEELHNDIQNKKN